MGDGSTGSNVGLAHQLSRRSRRPVITGDSPESGEVNSGEVELDEEEREEAEPTTLRSSQLGAVIDSSISSRRDIVATALADALTDTITTQGDFVQHKRSIVIARRIAEEHLDGFELLADEDPLNAEIYQTGIKLHLTSAKGVDEILLFPGMEYLTPDGLAIYYDGPNQSLLILNQSRRAVQPRFPVEKGACLIIGEREYRREYRVKLHRYGFTLGALAQLTAQKARSLFDQAFKFSYTTCKNFWSNSKMTMLEDGLTYGDISSHENHDRVIIQHKTINVPAITSLRELKARCANLMGFIATLPLREKTDLRERIKSILEEELEKCFQHLENENKNLVGWQQRSEKTIENDGDIFVLIRVILQYLYVIVPNANEKYKRLKQLAERRLSIYRQLKVDELEDILTEQSIQLKRVVLGQ